jgi:hypothetical protein
MTKQASRLDRFEESFLQLLAKCDEELMNQALTGRGQSTEQILRRYEKKAAGILKAQAEHYLKEMIRILNRCKPGSPEARLWKGRIQRAKAARRRGEARFIGLRVMDKIKAEIGGDHGRQPERQ